MPGPIVLAAVVEGHGEVRAVPHLLRRIAGELHGVWDVHVPTPFRLDSGKMLKPEELRKAVRFQSARVVDRGGVIVVRDGDDSPCPVTLAHHLRSGLDPTGTAVEVVVAQPEYEAWFLAALPSLRAHAAVRDGAEQPDHPESRRNATGALEAHMLEAYRETRHQEDFSARMDLDAALRVCRSFRRLVHAVQLLSS